MGRNVLKRIDQMTVKRKQSATAIQASLNKFTEIQFQSNVAEECHCNHLLPIQLTSKNLDRDEFIGRMYNEYGVKCVTQYYPLYRYDLFKSKGFSHDGLMATDHFYDNMVSLPFSHEITEDEIDHLCYATSKLLSEIK